MMTITEFLAARLDDDEAYARMAFADHNDAEAEWAEPWSGGVLVGAREDVVDTFDSGISRHMVRHDPARVLREVAAKRAMVDDLAYGGPEMGDAQDHVFRRLASVYSDHPAYQQEWTP